MIIRMECPKKLDDNKQSVVGERRELELNDKDTDCCEESTLKVFNGVDIKSKDNEERFLVRRSMIDHLSTNDQVFFKSLREDEEELNTQEKVEIVEELLDRNYGLFLAKFGNHLLKEHLCYFENRSEEESVIVDLHLRQLNKALEQKTNKKLLMKVKSETAVQEMEVGDDLHPVEKTRSNLRNQLLDHLSLSKDAHFKSQQVGEPDLQQGEKRDIAEELLDRSAGLFLARFGTHLLEEHLIYFDSGMPSEESYEVAHHLKHLRKTHCKSVSQVGIKNRRFEALKKLMEEGSYFCESEMRSRNPLLYEQLVGRFLTPEERKNRIDNIDTTNITFVNLLLEQMDRENVKKLRKEQEDAEDDAMEEEEEESSNDEMEADSDSEEDNHLDKTLWGEEMTDGPSSVPLKMSATKSDKKRQEKLNEEDDQEISDAEKKLLLEEFRSNMFLSFLQGKDSNFDYSQVDYNSDYDDLEARGQDEEEKYFDEESPQDASSNKMSDEEDMLDQYMRDLKPEPTTQQLADRMNSLTHYET